MLNIAHHSGACAGGIRTHVLVLTAHFYRLLMSSTPVLDT